MRTSLVHEIRGSPPISLGGGRRGCRGAPSNEALPCTLGKRTCVAEVPEISRHTAPLEPQAERPRKKQHQRRVPPATKAPGSIGRQARDKTSATSTVDRVEMGGALDAVLTQDSVEEDLGDHSRYSEPASSA